MRGTTFMAILFILCTHVFAQNVLRKGTEVAKGKMQCITTDKSNNVYIVYGKGDSVMYLSSTDKGKTFSKPSLVGNLPGLFASAMRGPQIAATSEGLIVSACTNKGSLKDKNIYAWPENGEVTLLKPGGAKIVLS